VAAKPGAPKTAPAKEVKPKRAPAPTIPPPSLADMRAAASKLAAAAGLPAAKVSAPAAEARAYAPTKKARTTLTPEELEHYRLLLERKRAEIVGDVSTIEQSALAGGEGGSLSHLPQHMADQGSDTFDQSLALDLVASQRKLLAEIDDALERIRAGTYGVCTIMGVPIGKARLDAKPWAKTCIEAARQAERGGIARA
jgi:RNA polymerase-binding protein DksA